jgi:hypothetical protein
MKILFEIQTSNGIKIRTTSSYWKKIISFKHPVIANKQNEVKETLKNPEQIRKSKQDSKVLLYYKCFEPYHVCVVVKVLNEDGFIITTYLTENIKEGEIIWPK